MFNGCSILNSQLQARSGEVVIDQLSQVEDTKGNNGERGENIAPYDDM